MAILDADKEGFLRSERSLIQTIGRAARNLKGRAILYADRITGSMERAIAESEKRRKIQLEHNKANNITPMGVSKRIADVMEGAYGSASEAKSNKRGKASDKSKGDEQDVAKMDAKSLTKEIAKLEARMYELARNLDFEEAAAARDRLRVLKDALLKA